MKIIIMLLIAKKHNVGQNKNVWYFILDMKHKKNVINYVFKQKINKIVNMMKNIKLCTKQWINKHLAYHKSFQTMFIYVQPQIYNKKLKNIIFLIQMILQMRLMKNNGNNKLIYLTNNVKKNQINNKNVLKVNKKNNVLNNNNYKLNNKNAQILNNNNKKKKMNNNNNQKKKNKKKIMLINNKQRNKIVSNHNNLMMIKNVRLKNKIY